MTKIRDLPLLAILPVDKMLLHEQHDQQRSPHLLENVRTSGVLRNPPIVSPLHDRTGRYLVLDGAHRTLVMQQLGLVHILAQVVEPDDPGLALNPWNHVLWELAPGDFQQSVTGIPYIDVVPDKNTNSGLELVNKQPLARYCLPDGEAYTIYPPTSDLITRLNFLNTFVDRYKDQARLDRTNLQDVEALRKLYPQLTGLVIFPRFRIEEVMYLAGAGYLLPTGTTRFTISPRALHVNYPLAELSKNTGLEEKNAQLQKWLQERLANKGVRYYAEATFLFDE
ncbi:MAG: ParB N-terminal domain-containing protein [Anaerolineales bacterium]|nr:MAG: ParB N-terminal domain-containing protein [Anaerolineales bacterium]